MKLISSRYLLIDITSLKWFSLEILEIVNPLYWITSNLSNKFSQLDILRFALLDLYNGYLSLNIFIFFSFEIISKIKVIEIF